MAAETVGNHPLQLLGGTVGARVVRWEQRFSSRRDFLQVVDDMLDITQTTEQLGKTAGKDLASSKTTYPSILGLVQVPWTSTGTLLAICVEVFSRGDAASQQELSNAQTQGHWY